MKNFLTSMAALASIFVLCACTSAPVTIEYYRLGASVDSKPSPKTGEDAETSVLLERVQLAGFLRQPGLVIQRGKNQLHLSKTHLWAEQLDQALPKVLQAKLQQLSSGYIYHLNPLRGLEPTDYRLSVRIDSLHASDEGEVIAEGRYQLISAKRLNKMTVRHFSFKRDLDQDGHSHAVAKIESLIELIAEDISSTIKLETEG